MNRFKINFQLQELDKVMPFGERLHWFALTDGLLWIDAGTQTIYEYSEAAQAYFGSDIKYNDYQIARFLEDFFGIFRYVGESVPKELYSILEQFNVKTEKWRDCHIEEEDEVFDRFYFNEYCELGEWYSNRLFDSGHLVGGPHIGCFRCGEKIKIIWKSSFKLDNGNSIWTAPEGCYEMPYNEFVSSVTEFFHAFFARMDKQVENAVMKDWGNIFLDKQRLAAENDERKAGLLQGIGFLGNTDWNTDWDRVMMLYSKMEDELNMAKRAMRRM
ncbi:DUF5984 family protein [Candidatus Merdisoma sp. JLR.KK006]|uniref:DUF5984 family protein n=1 Tax=Candidatus Merdisoma sp. JLR.KK006 TaxID=3112626 RepID=UPI002FF326C6